MLVLRAGRVAAGAAAYRAAIALDPIDSPPSGTSAIDIAAAVSDPAEPPAPPTTSMQERLDGLDFGNLGYGVVGLFVVTWAVSVVVWKGGRIEERWGAFVRD